MWVPYELTNQERESDAYIDTLVDFIIAHPHQVLVDKHREKCQYIPQDRASARKIIKSVLDCEIVYVGTRHGRPMHPLAGFTYSEALGLARLEYLVDYYSESSSETATSFLTEALNKFLTFMLKNHSTIQEVVFPVPIPESPIGKYTVRTNNGRYFAYRT
jgi:hypothetical protein